MELGIHAIPSEELVKELQSRYDATVILLQQNTRDAAGSDKGREDCDQWFSGGAYTGIGLCVTMIDRLRESAKRD